MNTTQIRQLTSTEQGYLRYAVNVDPSVYKVVELRTDQYLGKVFVPIEISDFPLMQLSYDDWFGPPNQTGQYTRQFRVATTSTEFIGRESTTPDTILINPRKFVETPITEMTPISPVVTVPTLPPARVQSITAPTIGSELTATVELVDPYLVPMNTFRATRLDDMFTVSTSLPSFNVHYEVGKDLSPDISFTSGVILIRNNTINQGLRFKVSLPQYLRTDSSTEFVLGKDVRVALQVEADPVSIKRLATGLVDLFQRDVISIDVQIEPPVTGPVFVRADLPLLTP